MDKNRLIGAKIKEAREATGKSQKDLADALKFESATAISLIEAGERKLKVEDLEKLAEFLHMDIKYFLGQESDHMDVKTALRADKDLTDKDKEAIMRFVDLAKEKKKNGNGGNR